MSLESELLARICAEPENHELRLVYADKLLDRGAPRGTFIAQQCELARLDVLDARYPSLLSSTRRLEAANAEAWLAPLLKRTHADSLRPFSPLFQRGFLHRVALEPETVIADWAWLTQQEPIDGLELIVQEALPKEARGISGGPNPRALKVRAERWVTASSVGDVLAWGMPALKILDLSGCDLSLAGCAMLTNAPTDLAEHFEDWKAPPPFAKGQLEQLLLHGCKIGDEGARVLFASEILSGLRALDLGQCGLSQKETLTALRESPHMQGLVSLSLAGNNALQDSLGALAGWSTLAKLERLSLPQVTSATELAALFPTPSRRLRALDLASAKALAKTPAAIVRCAEALTELDLGTTSLGDAGWATLLAAPCVEPLLELHANGCSLSDESIKVLTKSKLRRLGKLDLSSNKLTDEGLEALAKWDGLEHVTHLRLRNNRKVTAAGYEALMSAEQFVPAVLDVGKVDAALMKKLTAKYPGAVQVD